MQTTPNIIALDSATLNPGDLSWQAIEQIGAFKDYPKSSPDELVNRAKEADILLVNKVLIGEAVLNQLPRLKCICVTATGYNNVDLEAARSRAIPVCNAVGYSTDSVAQHVFAMLFAMTNKVMAHHQSIQDGDWSRQANFSYTLNTIPEIAGMTMGIYGFGRIGRRVGELAKAFGMKVLATHKHPERDSRPWVEFVNLKELFERSDVISLHAPLSSANKEIVNAELLGSMKKEAYLINTGRGGLINEADLKKALEQGQLAAAGLDVLSSEPPPKDHILYGIPNCILTPHIAWSSLEARQRLLNITVENIKAFLSGEPQNVVNA
ncbi:MAG: D-2-hydroxyacid dehydrogenase [Chitinophagales bacterium]|nr:D-2-hydroxyacid dehydrogenase [Chitinophagales bacterium]